MHTKTIMHSVYSTIEQQSVLTVDVYVHYHFVFISKTIYIAIVFMLVECVCKHTTQCKLHHVPISVMYVTACNLSSLLTFMFLLLLYYMTIVKMNSECVCAHIMQCKLQHMPIHSMYAKIYIAYRCNCSASVKSIGTTTCIRLMKREGAFLQSLLDTEHLQTMKSGILQSGMYDAFQNTYSIQCVCMCASIYCS